MRNLSDLGTIKEILSRHGFTFSKALGQNFLVNPTVCPRMAEACGVTADSCALEVGPGIGVLTSELAQRAGKVVAIELDQRLLPVLSETLAPYPNTKVINDDILKIDLASLMKEEFQGKPVHVCANLPYYITSPVIMRFLEEQLPVDSLTVMVQKEAADRICAVPGSRDVGALSIAVRYYAEPQILFRVSRGSFFPAPNVDSAVIRLQLHKAERHYPVEDEKTFFRLVRAAFGQRRKTLLNSLGSGFSLSKEILQAIIAQADIPLTARAEQLTMEQFAVLSNLLFQTLPSK